MKTVILALLMVTAALGSDFTFSGNVSYSEHVKPQLTAGNKAEFRLKLFEPKHKRYLIYGGGSIYTDYNVFYQIVNTHGFATLGIEY